MRLAAAVLLALALVAFGVGAPSAVAQEPIADLVISKSAEPEPVVSGGTLTYTIEVTNAGDAATEVGPFPIEITDLYPSEFTLTSFEITPIGGCIAGPGSTVTCEVTSLDAGESVTVTIAGTVSAPSGDIVHNIALVDLAVSHIPESSEVANNTASFDSTVLPGAVGGVSRDIDQDALGTGRGGLDRLTMALLAGLVITGVVLAGGVLYARRR